MARASPEELDLHFLSGLQRNELFKVDWGLSASSSLSPVWRPIGAALILAGVLISELLGSSSPMSASTEMAETPAAAGVSAGLEGIDQNVK
ncbi:MAG TPA: hypothetical protein VG498_24180 [Terriglobales bacterium]|nr:hypothetical protein [Terriglobales bacterium]